MPYKIIIIDDVLDAVACKEEKDYKKDRDIVCKKSAIERRNAYDKLLLGGRAGFVSTLYYIGNAHKPEEVKEFASKTQCDLIIIDENLIDMTHFKGKTSDADTSVSVSITKKLLDALKGINNNFYDNYGNYGKFPSIIRVTGRDSQSMTSATFVELQQRLDELLQEFSTDNSRTHFFNSILEDGARDSSEKEISYEGTKFIDLVKKKCVEFRDYYDAILQSSVLVTYVNDREFEGIKQALSAKSFSEQSGDDCFVENSQKIKYNKYVKSIDNDHSLAIFLIQAGPGVGAFIKKVSIFLTAQKRPPVRVGCVIVSGVAFYAKTSDSNKDFVAISKQIVDADMCRYENGKKSISTGQRKDIEAELVNSFIAAARENSIDANDVIVASADKLYKSKEATENLITTIPSVTVGEMEARGIIHLLSEPQLVKYCIMVKGISDKGDESKTDESQIESSRTAFDVVLNAISKTVFIDTYLKP